MFRLDVEEETFALKVDEENYNAKIEQIPLSEMNRKYMVYNFNTRLVIVGE